MLTFELNNLGKTKIKDLYPKGKINITDSSIQELSIKMMVTIYIILDLLANPVFIRFIV